MKSKTKIVLFLGMAFLLFAAVSCHAEEIVMLPTKIAEKYRDAASNFSGVLIGHATSMYWILATISLVWTGGQMLLRRAELAEFAGEFLRFSIFAGLYLWLLQNMSGGLNFINGLYRSFVQLAGEAESSLASGMEQSFASYGVNIYNTFIKMYPSLGIAESICIFFISIACFVIMILISINIALQSATIWLYGYIGLIFLGFGGCRWTSDIALTYFKTVIAQCMALFTMLVVAAIGKYFMLETTFSVVGGGDGLTTSSSFETFGTFGATLVASIALLLFITRLPPMIAGCVMQGGTAHVDPLSSGRITSAVSTGVALGMATVSAGSNFLSGKPDTNPSFSYSASAPSSGFTSPGGTNSQQDNDLKKPDPAEVSKPRA